jgi:branched-chain amino acid transport system ATP-binding protein
LATSALKLSHVDAFYGDSHVLGDVSFELGEARMLGLLGRNGAGKSTCMNVTMGLLPPRRGEVIVFGEPVGGMSPEMIAARGVALVPQGRRIFKSLTVRENLVVAARKPDPGSKHAPWTTDTVFSMFPRLNERRNQIAAHLSGGEQQMLAIARALMSRPKLLLLDEPSMGLAPLVVKDIFATLRRLNQMGVSMLLAEQNTRMALRTASRGYVLSGGLIVQAADAATLAGERTVRDAYLGV